MDRSLARPTALLAALLFLFTWTGEALGLHACPHHSGVPGAHAAVAGEAASSGGHASHAAVHRPDDDHGSAPAGGSGHETCTCQGSCPSAPGAALPPSSEAGPAALAAASAARTAWAKVAVRALHLPFVLPYGQAPPLQG